VSRDGLRPDERTEFTGSDDERAPLAAVGDRIEHLLVSIRSSTDGATWSSVEELVRLLTELYGAGLDLAVELGGPELARRLAADELGAGLLLLHGLHPDDLADRVAAAVDGLRPALRRGGAELEVVSTAGGAVRVVVSAAGGCGSTAERLRQQVSDALWSAAPDAGSIVVEAGGEAAAPVRLGPTRLAAARGAGARA